MDNRGFVTVVLLYFDETLRQTLKNILIVTFITKSMIYTYAAYSYKGFQCK